MAQMMELMRANLGLRKGLFVFLGFTPAKLEYTEKTRFFLCCALGTGNCFVLTVDGFPVHLKSYRETPHACSFKLMSALKISTPTIDHHRHHICRFVYEALYRKEQASRGGSRRAWYPTQLRNHRASLSWVAVKELYGSCHNSDAMLFWYMPLLWSFELNSLTETQSSGLLGMGLFLARKRSYAWSPMSDQCHKLPRERARQEMACRAFWLFKELLQRGCRYGDIDVDVDIDSISYKPARSATLN